MSIAIGDPLKGPVELLNSENNWITRMGLAFAGERVVFRGKDLFSELRDMRWMELFLYGITGRCFAEKQIILFEALWSLSTSYADPRIWNNRVASLAGTARSTGALGISAAIAVSEAAIYGFKPIMGAYDFIIKANKERALNGNIEALVLTELHESRTIPGYARPRINKDERIAPLLTRARELGFGDGKHLATAIEIERVLFDNGYRMRMNVAAPAAALAADQGLTRREYYQFVLPCFIAGMSPCFIEANERPAGTFLPLRCDRVDYFGKPSRSWQ